MVMLIRACRCPGVIGRVDRNARLPLPGKLPGHRAAEGVDAVDQERIDVRLDGIEVRRQEQPRAIRIHLMDVVHDLRMPDIVQRIDCELCLDLRESIPVAVVVVAGVIVIQLRR